ncbi:type VI secretion system tip protein TssI/VgrG [Neoroseomonas oryzicola]|uniref:Type VI secretion system tip protein VgrG n=1 Tax=Neoroseomonas oryzicola TaxID=535904 RepID=A0A9X9WLW7_9PROT|nr:type VI secretion system tip protein VgrG [Neoroseomonas oryzicola]NKE18817.1 type VI secretion system tip protein VgrG [Neoroseomonas oryzicola]
MPNYDQSNCLLAMHTTLAGWPVVLTELEGEDRLSAPFVYRIRFATEAPVAAVKALIGTEVTLFFGQPEPDAANRLRRRPLNGHFRRIARIGRVGRDGMILEWEAEVVPRLWFLSQTSDFRIFHDQTIPQIVATILGEHGIPHADRIVVPETYGTLEYCVQYDETALDFVSRLLEHAGVFYWHEHTDTAHTLCFTDNNNNVHVPNPPFETLVVGDGVTDRFAEAYSFRTGTWTVRDHNLTRPQRAWDKTESFADIASADASVVRQFTRFERYRFPGNYMARLRSHADGSIEGQVGQHDADLMATRLIEIEESHWERWTGASLAAGLDPGTKVRIQPDTEASAADYLVIGIRHRARDYSCWTEEEWALLQPGGDAAPPPSCDNDFDCVPHGVPFRPDRVTPKPKVAGPQTALVVGAAGQEINTDEYGRVQVQFLWDRGPPGAPAVNSAVWIRVSQGAAGAGWGHIHVPRVGQEVIVDFLNGDPDRPIITGRVYDTDLSVPYALPASATQSGIRTRSTPGGTAANYNELRFEDAIGAEQVLLHAERDYVVEVENNETRTVGMGGGAGNRSAIIKNDETMTIGGNRSVAITGNAADTIGGSETRTITGDVTETVHGNVTLNVDQNVSVTSGPDINLTATDTINITAPTVNINAEHHNRWVSKYDWQMGTGAGSFYVTTNYQAALTTNVYLASFNMTFRSVNVNAWTNNIGEFEARTKAMVIDTAATVARNIGTGIENMGVALGQAGFAMHANGLTVIR